MKQLLLDLLDQTEPARSTTNNCIELLRRERTLEPSAAYSHDELLLRARNTSLDTAQVLEQALLTARCERLDHAELLGMLMTYCDTLAKRLDEKGYTTSSRAALSIVRDDLKTLLHRHETSRTVRALRYR